MKLVLVTGADGFIGSHLVEILVKKGYEVRAFCLYNSFGSRGWLDSLSQEILDDIQVVFGDVRDKNSIKNAMKGCQMVFHLAALISIPYSYIAPESYVDTNIKGTLNILEAARELEINHTIHTSTSETYGTAQYVPIDEKHPLVGQSPYSASKIGADQLALSFSKSFSLPVSIVRPFNTYGPRQSTRAVIPSIITQILTGKKDLKLGNLSPTRDFNFVKDTCEGFLKVSQSSNTLGEVLNISSNFEISISDTVKNITKIMNADINVIKEKSIVRPKSSEVDRLYGSNAKIKKLTGWVPKYSGIEGFKDGLQETINWFSIPENLEFYNPKSIYL